MSFLYPRTISITRPTQPIGEGAVGYGAEEVSTETQIASGIQASIQLNKQRGKQDAGLPGDSEKTLWKILIPPQAVANGVIESRDIVTDDAGLRYQVSGPYWNSLGYNLLCELLET